MCWLLDFVGVQTGSVCVRGPHQRDTKRRTIVIKWEAYVYNDNRDDNVVVFAMLSINVHLLEKSMLALERERRRLADRA